MCPITGTHVDKWGKLGTIGDQLSQQPCFCSVGGKQNMWRKPTAAQVENCLEPGVAPTYLQKTEEWLFSILYPLKQKLNRLPTNNTWTNSGINACFPDSCPLAAFLQV